MWKNILFPKFCINCQREGEYLCQDCFSLIDIAEKHNYIPKGNLDNLYSPASYNNFIIRKLIHQFKHQYIKEIAKPLSDIILTHFIHLEISPNKFKDFVLVPVPLYKKKLKQRGFNPSEEIAKCLSEPLNLPIANILTKIKETPNQTELSIEQRRNNLRDAFTCIEPNMNILLIDDFLSTGTTMEQCAQTLKKSGANQVWGIVVARE